MINIALVGCGNWASKVINEINLNKNYNLNSIVCRKNQIFKNKIQVFKNIESLIESDSCDCIYIAALPRVNLRVIKLLKHKRIHLIIEKPVSDTSRNLLKIKKILENNDYIIYPNLTNYFSQTFEEFKRVVDINFTKIKEIIVYEGNFGPFRKEIHPIWDWGFHSISLLFLIFWGRDFSVVEKKEIISNNKYGRGLVTKFMFRINKNINVKIVTGNLFKKKLRKIKIILDNDNYIINDMVDHQIYSNNEIIFKNNETPLSSLLNKFENGNLEISKKLIDASYKTTNFLEKFYKC